MRIMVMALLLGFCSLSAVGDESKEVQSENLFEQGREGTIWDMFACCCGMIPGGGADIEDQILQGQNYHALTAFSRSFANDECNAAINAIRKMSSNCRLQLLARTIKEANVKQLCFFIDHCGLNPSMKCNMAFFYGRNAINQLSYDEWFEGCTPLEYAIYFGALPAAQLLVEKGAVVPDAERLLGALYLPIQEAHACGTKKIPSQALRVYVYSLLADVNILIKDPWKKDVQSAPLHIETKLGNGPLVAFLVEERNAKVAQKNSDGQIPLQIIENHLEVGDYLRAHSELVSLREIECIED